ncbi:type II toxin-antitoxin system VapC family toxin [Kribbia dieselivorans]|uniref:type II toxin-antitoxin system VapC family toxin n=1 Tax=Kribbia dieselivorans TaxID=331526 RepID=UPI000837C92B|nr:type II toxin-antitoxin system VapC family toxin [Kribbia dieselivorans]
MRDLLVDTSVLIKWFHSEGEGEVAEARAIRDAHVRGDLDVHVLDLAMYEVGNVLIRGLGWSAGDVADQLDDLVAIVGTPMAMPPEWFREAALLAERHTLSFYDACWAAAAVTLGVSLVTADRRLTAAGLAETATATTTRLNLELPG